MIQRLPCTTCGDSIHPDTAAKNGGLCMPCKGGYKQRIEDGKRRREHERQYEQSPERLYWLALVKRVHDGPGFDSLKAAEKTYYAVTCLMGEVYNGGFYQFFSNHSGALYGHALDGLMEMEAVQSVRLTIRAKALLFGSHACQSIGEPETTCYPNLRGWMRHLMVWTSRFGKTRTSSANAAGSLLDGTTCIEGVAASALRRRVQPLWGKAYGSLGPLRNWKLAPWSMSELEKAA